MRLTLDNIDYTKTLDAEHAPRIQRRLNRPSQLSLSLVAEMPGFVAPAADSRVVLETGETRLFTGYVTHVPDAVYLGWGQRGPVYRYMVAALSDEFILDRKMLPARAPFVARTAGTILKELVQELTPGEFDYSTVEGLALVPSYSSTSTKSWSEHAAELALLSRASYRAHDKRLYFQAVGANEYLLGEASAAFSPDGLKLGSPARLMNDVTVTGRSEPCAYVKDYFLGDGQELSFSLSHEPFASYGRSFVDEEFKGIALDDLRWSFDDAAGVVAVGGGKLRIAGGPATVAFVEQIELGGAVVLQHGEFEFTAPSSGELGALVDSAGQTLAAFRVEPSGNASRISATINGATAGTTLDAVGGCRYVLTTRIYASQVYRREQQFRSSTHVRGGGTTTADAHVILEVHVLDPARPGSPAAISTVLYEGTLSNLPVGCEYRLVRATDLHCELAFTRLSRAADVEVVSTLPGQASRTRLVGALSEGAECGISSAPALFFYTPYVPVPNEAIRVSYRTSGRSAARIADRDSIAANARGNDDGVRAGVLRLALPAPRATSECEQAALALLDDSTQPAWTGEYQAWSGFLPGGAADLWPGDGLHVVARGADFRAVVREVDVELCDPSGAHSRYTIRFTNDAATPLGVELEAARAAQLQEVSATTATVGRTCINDLPGAAITAITSTTVTVDAGCDPPSGGGFEVRRSDTAWGAEYDRNLAGRFTARGFTLTRLSRVQTYYLRQYDSAGRYSRYSTVLHVDYPL